MPAPLPCILLARPTSKEDPALLLHQGRPLLPRVLQELQSQGLTGPVIFSVSEAVPQEIRHRLADWGLDVRVHASDLPQERLLAVMRDLGLKAALVSTPYCYLLQAPSAAAVARAVLEGAADLAFTQEVTASRFLLAANLDAAEALARIRDYPVPPFSFPQKLQDQEGLRLHALADLEEPAEQFLWELFYAGQRSILPTPHLAAFLDETPARDWFQPEAQRRFLQRLQGVGDWAPLNPLLRNLAPIERVKRLAMQMTNARRMGAHLPEGRGRFLEVGHGNTPLASCLLSCCFEEGLAVEPFKHSAQGLAGTLDLFRELARQFPALLPFPVPAQDPDPVRRVRFLDSLVEDLGLPDASVDFCFSRVVLEHVMNVEGLSAEMHRVLRPGGVMFHEIGLNDHDDLSSLNFQFLRHSREEWAALDKSTNLWRVNDFAALWQSLGFRVEVLSRDVRRVPPARLHPCWRDYAEDDLYCYYAVLKATK